MKPIQWLVLDVDGVLTDGRIYFREDGLAMRAFAIQDGLALAVAPRLGIRIALVSGRGDSGLRRRAEELGIQEVHFEVRFKDRVVAEIARRHGVPRAEIAYMGDDLNDIPAMEIAGYRMTVPNAAPAVQRIADWISPVPGGHGAVRKAVEHLVERRGEDFETRVLALLRSQNEP